MAAIVGRFGDNVLIGGTPAVRDVIIGLRGDDILYGDAVGDLTGAAADDLLFGGSGNDQLFGDAGGSLAADVVGGDDRLWGGAGNDQLFGDSAGSIPLGEGRGGDDSLWGGHGDDYLCGDATLDIPFALTTGAGGIDRLWGGTGNDTLVGEGTQVRRFGEADWLYGGAGDDVIYGDASETLWTYAATGSDDNLFGGSGNDSLYGDALDATGFNGLDLTGGDDRLDGGTGADQLWGDAAFISMSFFSEFFGGADTFVFERRSGLDVINDFEQGKDRIDVSGYGITGFAGLVIGGAGNVVAFDGAADGQGDEVTVLAYGGGAVAVQAGDFIFAV